jgi:uncharacterized protein YecE (DUF72 family)
MLTAENIFIGTAGWTVPKQNGAAFPGEGTHLERYAICLNGVEINSSFYREHKAATYRKWADSTPKNFRFSVKLSKVFTHVQKLEIKPDELSVSLQALQELGPKLGVLLVQLPPSLQYDAKVASSFFAQLKKTYTGPLALEPRHLSWLSPEGLDLFQQFGISKVIADPERCPLDLEKVASSGMLYLRLHGTPDIYKSQYETNTVKMYLQQILKHRQELQTAWCIFDNTTFGHATFNALEMSEMTSAEDPALFSEYAESPALRV